MEPELAALCTQTVKAYAPGTTDAYGQLSYSATPLTLKCHIVGRFMEVIDKHGEAVTANGSAILTDCYPGLSDRYILDVPDMSMPSGWRRVNIISVVTRYDEKGPHHQVIYFGAQGGFAGGAISG
jgi:hypothetical protein